MSSQNASNLNPGLINVVYTDLMFRRLTLCAQNYSESGIENVFEFEL